MTDTAKGPVIEAGHLSLINKFQSSDISETYCNALSEISEYITMVDDPDLDFGTQLNWLQVISMVKKDIAALASK